MAASRRPAGASDVGALRPREGFEAGVGLGGHLRTAAEAVGDHRRDLPCRSRPDHRIESHLEGRSCRCKNLSARAQLRQAAVERRVEGRLFDRDVSVQHLMGYRDGRNRNAPGPRPRASTPWAAPIHSSESVSACSITVRVARSWRSARLGPRAAESIPHSRRKSTRPRRLSSCSAMRPGAQPFPCPANGPWLC
jgi:hypothetical protein